MIKLLILIITIRKFEVKQWFMYNRMSSNSFMPFLDFWIFPLVYFKIQRQIFNLILMSKEGTFQK